MFIGKVESYSNGMEVLIRARKKIPFNFNLTLKVGGYVQFLLIKKGAWSVAVNVQPLQIVENCISTQVVKSDYTSLADVKTLPKPYYLERKLLFQ